MRYLRLLQIPLVLAIFATPLLRIDAGEIREALSGVSAWPVLAAVALNLPAAALLSVRSHFVLLRLGHRVPLDVGVPVAVLGTIAGSVTPASSGEILRALALKSHADMAARDSATLVLVERGVSLYVLCIGSLAAFLFVTLGQPAGSLLAAAVMLLIAVPVLAAPLLLRAPRPTRVQPRPLRLLLEQAQQLSGRIHHVLSDWPTMSAWLAATAAIFALMTVQVWMLGRAVAPGISPAEAWIALALSQLAGIISLLPFGVGASDASLAAILGRYGMTLEEGAGVAVLIRVAITVPVVLLAVTSYLYLAWRMRRGRRQVAPLSPVER